MTIPRLRRISDVITEMKQSDPDTAMTEYALRCLINEGKLTQKKYDNAWLINIDELYALFKTNGVSRYATTNQPEWFRTFMRIIALTAGHCLTCTVLSGCYFIDNYPKRSPKHPLHKNCDCDFDESFVPKVFAECDIRKFTEYIFADKYASNGKRKLFEELGFLKNHSNMLQLEYQRQAALKYLAGEYVLGSLDKNGQRMNININFAHPTRGEIKFVSGWMIRPDGYITCNTPLGG